MSLETAGQEQTAWTALHRFARARPSAERCEMCGAELSTDHRHLLEPASRRILCACDACAVLFSQQAEQRYRRVPREIKALPDFRLSDQQWNGLSIPVGLAFFFRSTAAGRVVAIYPSPAGPTESLLDLGCWDDIERDNPVLAQMEPDTQALLVNRVRQARQYYVAPIDECYRLVGLLRTKWRGLSGGTDVWREIAGFFDELNERAD